MKLKKISLKNASEFLLEKEMKNLIGGGPGGYKWCYSKDIGASCGSTCNSDDDCKIYGDAVCW